MARNFLPFLFISQTKKFSVWEVQDYSDGNGISMRRFETKLVCIGIFSFACTQKFNSIHRDTWPMKRISNYLSRVILNHIWMQNFFSIWSRWMFARNSCWRTSDTPRWKNFVFDFIFGRFCCFGSAKFRLRHESFWNRCRLAKFFFSAWKNCRQLLRKVFDISILLPAFHTFWLAKLFGNVIDNEKSEKSDSQRLKQTPQVPFSFFFSIFCWLHVLGIISLTLLSQQCDKIFAFQI